MKSPATESARRRAYLVAGSLAAAAIITTRSTSMVIARYFTDRPMPRDLLLELVPYSSWAQYIADIVVLAGMVLLLVYLMRNEPRSIPRAVTVFALMYLMRAALIVLTPLASPHGSEVYGIMPSQNGMWPSGHSANILLGYLLVDGVRAPVLRRILLAAAVTEWVALLLSRGHYSIDIAGGMLLAYFVHTEWTRGSLFDPLKRIVEPQGAEPGQQHS